MAVRSEEVHLWSGSYTPMHFRLVSMAKLLVEKVETSLEGGVLSGHTTFNLKGYSIPTILELPMP